VIPEYGILRSLIIDSLLIVDFRLLIAASSAASGGDPLTTNQKSTIINHQRIKDR
jgi:hypothetical protein